MSVRKKQSDILTTRAPARLSLEQVLAVGVRKMALEEVKSSETLYTTGGYGEGDLKRERSGHFPVVADLDNSSNGMHINRNAFKRPRSIKITPGTEPGTEPEPEPKTEDNLVLWNGTHELCTNWNNDNDALGVRNIYAVFYLIAKLEAEWMKSNTVPKFMKCFPENEEWFKYKERFLAIYYKQYLTQQTDWHLYLTGLQERTGSVVEELKLTDSCTELQKSESVKIAKLPGRFVDKGKEWVDTINEDCQKNTGNKILEIVASDDLSNESTEVVVLAAENVELAFKYKFKVNDDKETADFYGTKKGDDGKWTNLDKGQCHMMHKCENKHMTWKGNKFEAAFIETTQTGLYFVAVLPTKDPNEEGHTKYTTQKEMEEAAEEIKNNCTKLCEIANFGKWTRKLSTYPCPDGKDVCMPRVQRQMQPVDVAQVCGPTRLGKEVVGGEFVNITEKRAVTDHNLDLAKGKWKESNITSTEPWHTAFVNIAKVIHSTCLNVNEYGAEVAAATAAVFYRSIGIGDEEKPPEPEPVYFNRGYLIYIMDFNNDTPHVLFYARITNDECLKNAPPGTVIPEEPDW